MSQQDPIAPMPIVQAPPKVLEVLPPNSDQYLAYSKPPRGIQLIAIPTAASNGGRAYFPIMIGRPMLLLMYDNSLSGGELNQFGPVSYWSETIPDQISAGSSPVVFSASPRDAWLWSAGKWYISIDPTAVLGAGSVQFLAIPLEDPSLVRGMLAYANRALYTGSIGADTALVAAAAEVTIMNLPTVLLSSKIEVQNVGAANTMRLGFAGTAATNASGVVISAGQKYTFDPISMPATRLTAFSQLGTSYNIVSYSRFIP